MLNLNDLRLFVQAVEHGSFTAAARHLGMPKSTVSKRVAELEAASAPA
jgi:DNA-binding transcriptional LysR family regulator